VNAGATSLGIRATNGVVLATEKKLPSILVDEATVQKVSLVTPNVGMTYSGMGPDSRVLVRKARKSGQVYYRQYHEQIPVAQLCRETAAVMQEFTRECASGVLNLASVLHCYCCQGALVGAAKVAHGSRSLFV
jgi:20S proteasome subunit alpha 2